MSRLEAALAAAQMRAESRGLAGPAAISAVADEVGFAPRPIPFDNDHHSLVAEGIPVLGNLILFEPEGKTPSSYCKFSIPDRLMKPENMRKIVQPEFTVLATPEFGHLLFALDCLVYPKAAAFLAQFITSQRARAQKDAELLPNLPFVANGVWPEIPDVDTALAYIDQWYVTCAYSAYLDQIGAFGALLRALRLLGANDAAIRDVYCTLGGSDTSLLKNETWDLNMMHPTAVVRSIQNAREVGVETGAVSADAAEFFPRPTRFFATQNLYDEQKFQSSLAIACPAFHLDEATIRMTSAMHSYYKDEVNVKTILRDLCKEVFENCRLGIFTRDRALEWATQLAAALRPDLTLVVLPDEDGVPVFKLCRKPKN